MKELIQIVLKGLHLFSRRGRAIIGITAVTLTALSAIDVLALYFLASVFQLSNQPETQGILVNTTSAKLILILMLFATRSIMSAAATWVSARHLAKEQTEIGIRNFRQLMNPYINTHHSTESRQMHYFNSVDRGPEFLTFTMMSSATMVSEIVSIAVILGVFFFFEPMTAAVTLFYFCSVVIVQHRVLSSRSALQGSRVLQARNLVYQKLLDASELRDILSEPSRSSLTASLSVSLSSLTRATALSQVYSMIPRYLLDLTFAIGLGVMGFVSLLVSGPTAALASLALFAGISFRLLPIVNRIQGLALTMITHAPTARLAVLESSSKPTRDFHGLASPNLVVQLTQVGFRFSANGAANVLSDISLCIENGKQYAIVGPSGSGKTTLASILLGIESPTEGLIQRNPAFRSAFVPQETHLAFASLAENVALLWDRSLIDMSRIEKALKFAGLDHFVDRILDPTPLMNDALSGGEKQRIGLARSIYTGANFIVFDEVTSSLDAVTESGIVETLYGLRGELTTVIIAHRLSTVQHADEVFYLEAGRLLGTGTFAKLATDLPKLRQQIELGQIQLLN